MLLRAISKQPRLFDVICASILGRHDPTPGFRACRDKVATPLGHPPHPPCPSTRLLDAARGSGSAKTPSTEQTCLYVQASNVMSLEIDLKDIHVLAELSRYTTGIVGLFN